MAQFSVYRNKNPRTKAAFPFLVDVQSDLLEPLNTRVVVPMTKAAALTRKPVSHLTPEVSFNDDRYVLMTPQLAGVGRAELGPHAGTLAEERHAILAAIDFLLTGF
ncbi:MAG: toxin, CcdB family [Gammaproteobacteria bacterium]|nr:toxin, CcdB family [Gammaproteobacteria bacterium]